MCGIAGVWQIGADGNGSGQLAAVVSRMTSAIAHRGPDGDGQWCDEAARICLGHRRLAVIDLAETGRQPMVSASGRYVIVFNGEIYNFRGLRRDLGSLGHGFRGTGDTEVALAAIEQWGVNAAVERFVGMFAFALWDREQRAIWLARDRLGKKPLYYSVSTSGFAFASELKALLLWPEFDRSIDRRSVARYLRYGCVPGPESIFSAARKLLPGSIALVSPDAAAGVLVNERQYWSPRDIYLSGRRSRRRLTLPDAATELEGLLSDAVRIRLESDVPLGGFLSGGFDSTVIVGLMQREAGRAVKTFTVGFGESEFDESGHARLVARHFGTDHTEIRIDASDVIRLVPDMPEIFDEPFADASQIPAALVARVARQHVTVALTGDGGDEVFGGYRRYQRFAQLWRIHGSVPGRLRPAAAAAIEAFARSRLRALWPVIERLAPGDPGSVTVPQQLVKIAALLRLDGVDAIYERQLMHWADGIAAASAGDLRWWTDARSGAVAGATMDECFDRLMELDLGHYLPDDILVKIDRTSMHVGLEARAPLLDHRVVEFAASLPVDLRVIRGSGKRVLKEVAYRLAPRELLERPKRGFSVPLARWLRGPLREWTDDMLSAENLARTSLVRPEPVLKCWHEHRAGCADWASQLWDVLMLLGWHRRYLERPAELL
jgi:asparagine synthase (glutamine-hydrolysing)